MIDTTTGLAAQQDVRDVAAMWEPLRARLTPTTNGTGGGARGKPGSRPPIDVAVSDLLAEVEWQARFFAQVLMEESTYVPVDSTTPMLLSDVAELFGHWVTGDERMALDFCDTWHELRRKVAGVIITREPRRWLGPCLVAECEGDLYARANVAGMRCTVCGTPFEMADVRDHLAEAFEVRLMTRGELVSALYVMGIEVKMNTVDQWCSRGRLKPEVADPYLYRFADALALADKKARMVA